MAGFNWSAFVNGKQNADSEPSKELPSKDDGDRIMIEQPVPSSPDKKTLEYVKTNGVTDVKATPKKKKEEEPVEETTPVSQEPVSQPENTEADVIINALDEADRKDSNLTDTLEAVDDMIRNQQAARDADDNTSQRMLEENQIGRYNWNLQHGFVIPAWTKDWQAIAEIENRIPTPRTATGGLGGGLYSSAQQRQLNRIGNMWKEFQNAIKNGHFNNGDGTLDLNQVVPQATRLKMAYAKAGGNIDELYALGDNTGGNRAKSSAATQKLAREATFAETSLDKLQNALASGTYNAHNLKAGWDKIADLTAKMLSESGAAISDDEKIRNQYLTQPKAAMDTFNKTFDEYKSFLKSMQKAGLTREWYENSVNQMNTIKLNTERAASNDATAFAYGLQNLLKLAFSNDDFMATSPSLTLAAANTAWKEYKEGMIREAQVDPNVLWAMLVQLQQDRIAKYSVGVRDLGGIPRSFKTYNINNPLAENWSIAKNANSPISFVNYRNEQLIDDDGYGSTSGNKRVGTKRR